MEFKFRIGNRVYHEDGWEKKLYGTIVNRKIEERKFTYRNGNIFFPKNNEKSIKWIVYKVVMDNNEELVFDEDQLIGIDGRT